MFVKILVSSLCVLTLTNNASPVSLSNYQLSVDAGILAVASGDVCVEIWRPRK